MWVHYKMKMEIGNFMEKKKRKLVIIGCGGIGILLCRCIHKLSRFKKYIKILVDADIVEIKNLKRQWFHPEDIGRHKVQIAKSLFDEKDDVHIIPEMWEGKETLGKFEFSTTKTAISEKDIIIICTDNNIVAAKIAIEYRKRCHLLRPANEHYYAGLTYISPLVSGANLNTLCKTWRIKPDDDGEPCEDDEQSTAANLLAVSMCLQKLKEIDLDADMCEPTKVFRQLEIL